MTNVQMFKMNRIVRLFLYICSCSLVLLVSKELYVVTYLIFFYFFRLNLKHSPTDTPGFIF